MSGEGAEPEQPVTDTRPTTVAFVSRHQLQRGEPSGQTLSHDLSPARVTEQQRHQSRPNGTVTPPEKLIKKERERESHMTSHALLFQPQKRNVDYFLLPHVNISPSGHPQGQESTGRKQSDKSEVKELAHVHATTELNISTRACLFYTCIYIRGPRLRLQQQQVADVCSDTPDRLATSRLNTDLRLIVQPRCSLIKT